MARRSTFAEGLYSGLVAATSAASGDRKSQAGAGQRAAKLQLLVEAPAAVEDALASLLNHIDPEVQVGCKPFGISAAFSCLLLSLLDALLRVFADMSIDRIVCKSSLLLAG